MLHKTVIKPVWGDYSRQWMFDDYFDLYVWYETDGSIHGFQLCYDKEDDERALTWTQPGTFQHTRIDTGETRPTANRSPILTAGCPFDREPLRTEFLQRAAEIEPEIRALVLDKLEAYPV